MARGMFMALLLLGLAPQASADVVTARFESDKDIYLAGEAFTGTITLTNGSPDHALTIDSGLAMAGGTVRYTLTQDDRSRTVQERSPGMRMRWYRAELGPGESVHLAVFLFAQEGELFLARAGDLVFTAGFQLGLRGPAGETAFAEVSTAPVAVTVKPPGEGFAGMQELAERLYDLWLPLQASGVGDHFLGPEGTYDSLGDYQQTASAMIAYHIGWEGLHKFIRSNGGTPARIRDTDAGTYLEGRNAIGLEHARISGQGIRLREYVAGRLRALKDLPAREPGHMVIRGGEWLLQY